MLAVMLRMRVERVLETAHTVEERCRRRVHTTCADARDHPRTIHDLEIACPTDAARCRCPHASHPPCLGRPRRRFRARRWRAGPCWNRTAEVAHHRPYKYVAGGIVPAEPEMTARQIVIHHRTGGAIASGSSVKMPTHLHPVGRIMQSASGNGHEYRRWHDSKP